MKCLVQCIHVAKNKKAGFEEKLKIGRLGLEMTQWLRTWTLLLWRSGAGFTTPTLGPSKFPELQLQVIEYSHLDSMETFTCMHIPTYSHILHIVYIIKNNESESLKKIPMA